MSSKACVPWSVSVSESIIFTLLSSHIGLDVLEEKSWHFDDDCISLAINTACSLCGMDFIVFFKKRRKKEKEKKVLQPNSLT